MARLMFEEPADGGYAIDVSVTNPDAVIVFLSKAGDDDEPFVCLSYWQLERIARRIRSEFAMQLDREARAIEAVQ